MTIIYFLLLPLILSQSQLESDLLDLINKFRQDNFKPPLSYNEKLNRAAKDQSTFMCTTNNLTHDGNFLTNSKTLSDRLLKYDYVGEKIGENIAKQKGNDYKEVFRIWKKSSEHRKNMLGDYSGIGVSTCLGDDNERYWVNVFGKLSKNSSKDLKNKENDNNPNNNNDKENKSDNLNNKNDNYNNPNNNNKGNGYNNSNTGNDDNNNNSKEAKDNEDNYNVDGNEHDRVIIVLKCKDKNNDFKLPNNNEDKMKLSDLLNSYPKLNTKEENMNIEPGSFPKIEIIPKNKDSRTNNESNTPYPQIESMPGNESSRPSFDSLIPMHETQNIPSNDLSKTVPESNGSHTQTENIPISNTSKPPIESIGYPPQTQSFPVNEGSRTLSDSFNHANNAPNHTNTNEIYQTGSPDPYSNTKYHTTDIVSSSPNNYQKNPFITTVYKTVNIDPISDNKNIEPAPNHPKDKEKENKDRQGMNPEILSLLKEGFNDLKNDLLKTLGNQIYTDKYSIPSYLPEILKTSDISKNNHSYDSNNYTEGISDKITMNNIHSIDSFTFPLNSTPLMSNSANYSDQSHINEYTKTLDTLMLPSSLNSDKISSNSYNLTDTSNTDNYATMTYQSNNNTEPTNVSDKNNKSNTDNLLLNTQLDKHNKKKDRHTQIIVADISGKIKDFNLSSPGNGNDNEEISKVIQNKDIPENSSNSKLNGNNDDIENTLQDIRNILNLRNMNNKNIRIIVSNKECGDGKIEIGDSLHLGME